MPFFHNRKALIQMKSINHTIKLEQSVRLTKYPSFSTLHIFTALHISIPSLPCEVTLMCNMWHWIQPSVHPSLPCESMLMYNIISDHLHYAWHYRLLKNFNRFTNDNGVILVRLYFRHFCQGP